ncbi:MAG: CRISPR-associated protein Cas4 [Oscillospiraceae bacterium]|nr:CRISPR-associated protein Cas4 [Oscillospiraceae bacterium]
MEYNEDDFLQLSGIQHFKFCRRRWALIHIEDQWAENFRTVDGELMHQNAHDEGSCESRGNVVITRGVRVFSPRLGVSGACDILEFHRGKTGISLRDRHGLWQPFPVEYKRGKYMERTGDTLQLCGQAMCLEEMLCCGIPAGALYYGEVRRRIPVEFTPELRREVEDDLREMHLLYERGTTPKVKPGKYCGACSLKELCLPKLMSARPVKDYFAEALEEMP